MTGLALLSLIALPAMAQDQLRDRVEKARRELLMYTEDDVKRLRSREYVTGKLREFEALAREEILRNLNSEKWTDSTLRQRLSPVLVSGPLQLSLIHKLLNGIDVVIVEYSVAHGPSAIPDSTVFIQAYRKVADRYELADQTGDGLANSMPKLEELSAPSGNEVWLLAHGQQTGVMQYHERVRIYSFDGEHFKELWGHEPPLCGAAFKIEKNEIKIDFSDEADTNLPEMVLTLAILPQGPMQISLLRKQ